MDAAPGEAGLNPGAAGIGERELLSRARAGDRQAQAELYENHIYGSGPIRSLLRRCVADEAQREDLLHEIFLAATGSGTEFHGDSQLSTYLFRVAQLTVFQAHRAANTQKRGAGIRLMGEAEWAHDPASEPRAASLEFEEVETRLAFERLIERVPETYREALRLRIVEELDYQEIAGRLKIPAATVATRIFKGKAAMVKALRGLRSHRPARGA